MAKERGTLKNELNRNEGGSSVPQVLKRASAQWKKMSEEDKAPYDAPILHCQNVTHIGVQHGVLLDGSKDEYQVKLQKWKEAKTTWRSHLYLPSAAL